MTTTQQTLLGAAVVAPVEAPHQRAVSDDRQATTRLSVTVPALDLVAAAVPALVVQLTLDAWSPVVQVGVPVVWLLLVAGCGGYASTPGARRQPRVRAVARAAFGLALALWTVAAVAPGLFGDVGSTARAALALVASVLAATLGLRRVTARGRPSRVVVAGDATSVRDLLHDLRRAGRSRSTTFQPVAVCLPDDVDEIGTELAGLPSWPGLDRVAEIAYANQADAVIVVPGPHLDHDELRRLRGRLRKSGTDLLVSTGLRDVGDGCLELGAGVGTRLLHVRPAPLSGPALLVKDAVDRAAAAVLLVLLAPLLAILMVLIRLDSPGAALFRQVRVGQDGRSFTLFKLRTMRAEAETAVAELAPSNESDPEGVLFKIRRDPRLTTLGGVLRRYSLDELPQLINVVRGDMSLIGPRPALPDEVRAYSQDLRRRLDVRPGMTGLWQVSGRSDLPWDETVRLDLAYVDNWSWSLDLTIALRTATAVLGHRGAY